MSSSGVTVYVATFRLGNFLLKRNNDMAAVRAFYYHLAAVTNERLVKDV